MKEKNPEEELFQGELNALKRAEGLLKKENIPASELMSSYKELLKNFRSLLKLTIKIFKINDSQGRIVKKRENKFKSLLDNAGQGFLSFGNNLTINNEYSLECIKIFGRKIGGCSIVELLAENDNELKRLFSSTFNEVFSAEENQRNFLGKLPQQIKIDEKLITLDYKLLHKEDHLDEDEIIMIITDITEKYQAEQEILYLSFHDKLTSLYNRNYIFKHIQQIISRENLPLSLIVGDLNGLKITNDIFGHLAGDNLIISIAEVLKEVCGTDSYIARWGGDEFLIFLPYTKSATAHEVCENIKKACRDKKMKPIELDIALGVSTLEDMNLTFDELFNIAEEKMYQIKTLESKTVKARMIEGLKNELNNNCYESLNHLQRVEDLALKLLKQAKIPEMVINSDKLVLLAQMHDVGKVSISSEILAKPGELDPGEWEKIKHHSEIGYRLLRSLGEPDLAGILLAIHERWDGNGYPQGLKEQEIPLAARLLAIVEAYDVMVHDRPYRKAVTPTQALNEIAGNSGTQFDPELVKHFFNCV